jgi:hypothetical protein
MPVDLSPKALQHSVRLGYRRLHNFRQARMMFLRNYVGQYYDQDHGDVGTEPMNLIFNAIRVLVPNIVMNYPKHKVGTNFLDYRDYAKLLGLGLDFNGEQLGLKHAYRRAIVDAIFTIGILKTGLADSNAAITFDDDETIDPGMVYTGHVEFDNFVTDPTNRGDIREASWHGDRIRIPRAYLLDSGLYNNALIERLPRAYPFNHRDRASGLSMKNVNLHDIDKYEDEVEVIEVCIPKARATVTVPAPLHSNSESMFVAEDYLRVADYNGPDKGPYSFLALTPPVPGNPIPIAAVGIWNDLHVMANRMMKKTLDQADRQKDLVAYRRSSADDAQEALDAGDGETVAMDDPQGVVPMSFGGQQQGNTDMVGYLQVWFNTISGNPQGVGGQALDADSATEAQILQGNASITLEDMKDLVYDFAADEGKKRLYYIHTDPLINIPLAKRMPVHTPNGIMMQEVQLHLTPEARRGDWIDYSLKIQPESLGRIDANTKLQRAMEFAIKVLPAVFNATMAAAQMGIAFNPIVFLEHMAEAQGVEWMEEVWYDPTFQQRLQLMMQLGPQMAPSKGQPASAQPNGQPRNVMKVRDAGEQLRRDQQMGAAQAQSQMWNNQRF